ncbi:MAG: cupin [Planctomyces sp.]|nr:cupin [Planctomyces sp.]
MSIPHAKPGEVIDVRPLGSSFPGTKTHTLFKTSKMETLRLVLPQGKTLSEHKAPGEITIHCLEGEVRFTSLGKTETLHPGTMLYLSAGEPHAVEAVEDSSILLTLLLP